MRKKDIGMMLIGLALGAVLLGTAVPAKAAEPPAGTMVQAEALKVSSYKGNSLEVGDRSMVVISPYGTSVTAISSNPGVIALEQIGGFYVMVVKSTGTAVVSITDDAGNTASMTMTVGGAESSPTPPPAESSSPAQAPESSDPVVNSEWSHNPDTDLTANMDIRQEMVWLINQVRQEHGLAELPITVEFFYRSCDCQVGAALFFVILLEVGKRSFHTGNQQLELSIQNDLLFLRQLHLAIGEPGSFFNRVVITRERCEGGKLRRPVRHGHPGMPLRGGMRQVDDVVIGSAHALCPPICRFRSLAVAPSWKFMPFRMAFFPKRFLMSSIALCTFFSRSRAAASRSCCSCTAA